MNGERNSEALNYQAGKARIPTLGTFQSESQSSTRNWGPAGAALGVALGAAAAAVLALAGVTAESMRTTSKSTERGTPVSDRQNVCEKPLKDKEMHGEQA